MSVSNESCTCPPPDATEMPSLIAGAPSISRGTSVYLSEIASFISIAGEEPAFTKPSSIRRPHQCTKSRMKVVLMIGIFALVALAGYLTFHFDRITEEEDFYSAFDAESNNIMVNFYEAIYKMRLTAFSYTYEQTALSGKTNADWPFVTIHEFESATFASFHDSAATNYFLAPIVRTEERQAWEEFAVLERPSFQNISRANRSIADGMYHINGGAPEDCSGIGPHSPIWHVSPSNDENQHLMFNQASEKRQADAIEAMIASNSYTTSRASSSFNSSEPHAVSFFPIFRNLFNNDVVASFSLLWDVSALFETECATESTIVAIVIENACGQHYTFRAASTGTGSYLDVSFTGEGDQHDKEYDAMEANLPFSEEDIIWQTILSTAPPELAKFIHNHSRGRPKFDEVTTSCDWTSIRIYPTHEYEKAFHTHHPIVIGLVTSMALLLITFIFIAYAFYVERHEGIVYKKTRRSSEINGALVKSMFPSVVRDRVVRSTSYRCAKLARNGVRPNDPRVSKVHSIGPIAEQFKSTTVFFADIVGFTAWSSQREPEQVFQLLEALYDKFDQLAARSGVFKVETIGDCYMAVTGLPTPRHDHAIVAAHFASECLKAMQDITKNLEAQLGPGTANLALRIGLHSGVVTGGVLRGEKARFQLFGDTVNTAARMESLGIPGKIQVSQATADLITAGGKQHWLVPRKQLITAKGKGEMQTYFIKPRHQKVQPTFSKRPHDSSQFVTSESGLTMNEAQTQTSLSHDMMHMLHDSAEDFDMSSHHSRSHLGSDDRLIEWNTYLLFQCLFGADPEPSTGDSGLSRSRNSISASYKLVVHRQLNALLSHISTLFPDLPYHSFEHSSAVAMFANKLMKQGVEQLRSTHIVDQKEGRNYAIAHFAVVFSVLVVDTRYRQVENNQSCDIVAIVLGLLRADDYDTLGFALCSASEGGTFERVFTECMKASNMTFASEYYRGTKGSHLVPVASTISNEIEPSAQLSGALISMTRLVVRSCQVAHWFQHWSTFFYWHQRSFLEIRGNFLKGENTYDPSKTWHRDELLFFDRRIREMASALELGGLGGEHAERAEENYREWQMNGKQITDKLMSSQRGPTADLV